MFVGSWFGTILIIVVFVIIVLIIWSLTHQFTPKTVNPSCANGQSCPSGFFCSSGVCLVQGTCRGNQDCPAEQICSNGRCQECTSNGQCAVGSTCVNGRCSVTPCQRQTDCPEGEYCNIQPGQTISLCQPNACQSNANCPIGQVCESGICLSIGETCSTDRDCHRGTLNCIDGRCQQCRRNADCPDGVCLREGPTGVTGVTGTLGICVTGCSPHCPTGYKCNAGKCCPEVHPCGNYCSTSHQCSGPCSFCKDGICTCQGSEIGENCQVNEDCISGLCHNGICQQHGAECFIGEHTCPKGNPYCVNGKCRSSAEGLICGSNGYCDSTCPDNLFCVNDRCSSSKGGVGDLCQVDTDCVTGTFCDEGKCKELLQTLTPEEQSLVDKRQHRRRHH